MPLYHMALLGRRLRVVISDREQIVLLFLYGQPDYHPTPDEFRRQWRIPIGSITIRDGMPRLFSKRFLEQKPNKAEGRIFLTKNGQTAAKRLLEIERLLPKGQVPNLP